MTDSFAPYARLRALLHFGWRHACAAVLCAATVVAPGQTQTAVANGETRTLTLFHAHTQESLSVTFRSGGSYDSGALAKLNMLLRDWRNNEQVQMDPRLFDIIWEVQRSSGNTGAVKVMSAYRSPATNGMLRRRSRAVAKNSQHMLGKAMDIHIPGASMGHVRQIGMQLQRGGVGYYPTAGSPFVHLDVGSVRSWPRMPRPQLERLFPDGMTVHLPADGTPLANYEAALAMIQSRGGSAFSYADVSNRSLWSILFGGDEEDADVAGPRGKGGRGGRGAQQVASLALPASDSSSVYAIGGVQAPPEVAAPVLPEPVVRGRRGAAAKPKPLDEAPVAPAATTAVASLTTSDAVAEPAASALRSVAVPAPPRRPAGLTDAMVAVASPLPPARPGQGVLEQIASAADVSGKAEAPLQVSAAPAPPLRPTAFASAGGAVGGADLPGAITGGISAPTQKIAMLAVKTPVPPARPAQYPRGVAPPPEPVVVAAAPAPLPAPAPKKPEAKALDVLMASVATGSIRGAQPDKVAMPSVRQAVGSGIVASRMGDSEPTQSGRFTRGIITQPLDAGFVKRGD